MTVLAEASVRERPILFSGEMVRAILDGRKSQTRRVVTVPGPTKTRFGATLQNAAVTTWQREAGELEARGMPADDCHYLLGPERDGEYLVCNLVGDIGLHREHCPYGNVGDRLWVRETWGEIAGKIRYRADFHEHADTRIRFKPSIHMPRRVSRLTLEITGVRVERVQDISNADAEAEGFKGGYGTAGPGDRIKSMYSAGYRFKYLWNELNAKRGYGWGENPWVWVIAFRHVPALAMRDAPTGGENGT